MKPPLRTLEIIYSKGWEEGRETAKGFHKGYMNARERQTRSLSPYMRSIEPEKHAAWRRGYLAGYEDYWRGVPSVAPASSPL